MDVLKRCTAKFELARADELRLGDLFLEDTSVSDQVNLVEVTSLVLVGVDVVVNDFLTTSVGSTFLRRPRA